MMSKRTTWLSLVAAVLAFASTGSQSQAAPFQLSGTFSLGDVIQIKYQNFEVTANTAGQNLYGIIYVSSIEDATKGTTLWAQGQNGQGQVAGTFNNYVSQGVKTSASGLQEVTFTGGNVNLYYNPTVVHTLTGSKGTNANPDGNGTWTVGSLFVSAMGVPGISTTVPTATLDSTGNFTTTPVSGTGFGYLNQDTSTVPAKDQILTQVFGNVGRALLQSNINSKTLPNDPWPIESHDPIQFTVVPEPSSIALLGMGLISLVGVGRRSRRKAVTA